MSKGGTWPSDKTKGVMISFSAIKKAAAIIYVIARRLVKRG